MSSAHGHVHQLLRCLTFLFLPDRTLCRNPIIVKIVFVLRSKISRLHFLASATYGLMTGQMDVAAKYFRSVLFLAKMFIFISII